MQINQPAARLHITTKLALLLLLFIFIFYGTIALVFFHTQKMKAISQTIVTVNTSLVNHSKVMIENLLDMDANAQKYEVLEKDSYKEYYQTAHEEFLGSLVHIDTIISKGYVAPASFIEFQTQYREYQSQLSPDKKSNPLTWVDKETAHLWLQILVELRDTNQQQINNSLLDIHKQAGQSIQSGLFGFSLSVIASILGVWFISKSIIIPLKQLTHGLRTLSQGKRAPTIHVSSKDAFQELAIAYNEMSSELQEQENLRSDFIATLSHEIRTPLTSIQESINLILEEIIGPITEKQKHFLSIAREELLRIQDLLNQLMHTSILEIKPLTTTSNALNPNQLISDCIAAISASARVKNITIDAELEKDLPDASANKEDMQQVLLNLLGNSLKFSPDNSTITIKSRQEDKQIHLYIKDQGPGILEEEKKLIFKKYYRSKAVRKHMSGVGLGLYICQKIMHDLGGKISVINNPKHGCTFTLILPVHQK